MDRLRALDLPVVLRVINALALSVGLLLTLAHGEHALALYPAWFWYGALLLAAATTLGAFAEVARPDPRHLATRAAVVLAAGLLVVHPLVVSHERPWVELPPLWHFIHAALCTTALSFGVRAGIGVTVASVPAFVLARIGDIGPAQAALEAVLMASAIGAWTATLSIFERTSQAVEDSTRTAWADHEQLSLGLAVAAERETWRGLIHDKVLGALLLAARATDTDQRHEAAQAAREAIAAIRDGRVHRRPRTVTAALDRHLSRLGTSANVSIEDDLEPGPMADALGDALGEVLTNITRHAYADTVTIRGRLTGTEGRLRVEDDGIGFTVAADLGRAGLRTGVVDRMRAVGGDAGIRSTPGEGTVVTLTYQLAPAREPEPPPWDLAALVPLLWAVGVSVVAQSAIGVLHLDASWWPWLTLATVLGAIAVDVWSVTGAMTGRRPWLVAGAAAGVNVLGVLAIADPGVADWRWFFVGTTNVAAGALALRVRPMAGFTVAVASLVAAAMTLAARGGLTPAPLVAAYPQLFALAAEGSLIRLAIQRARRQIAQVTSEAGADRIALVATGARIGEAAKQVRLLERSVLPMLHRIADDEPLDPLERQTCLELEAAARDQLQASALLTDDVGAALAAARGRGAVVEVATREGDDEGLAGFRAVVLEMLAHLGPGNTSRVLWRPRPDGRRGSITVSGVASLEASRLVTALGSATDALAVVVTTDDQTMLVELLRPVQAGRG